MSQLKGCEGERPQTPHERRQYFSLTPQRRRLWCIHSCWGRGKEVLFGRRSKYLDKMLMWHPFAWVIGPCTEAILRAPRSQSTPQSHLWWDPSCPAARWACVCMHTTITFKSVNETICELPPDIYNNLILFTSTFSDISNSFFVSEMERRNQSLICPQNS